MEKNYYNESRKFYLNQIDLRDIVEYLENNYENEGPDALHSYEEAQEWYEMVLKNAGDISANFIEPRAEDVDAEGCTLENGQVSWTEPTKKNMEILTKAGFMGGTLDRKYGGLNLPITINNAIVEMVSQADASLMNLFGLQDIAVTISKFGSEEQKDRVLPKFCKGEVSGSMALTEPDAGSDLQAVELKAIKEDGQWYLDGVKRFITNGCGDVSLVLARSEEGSKSGRGLSMFLYERYRDDNLTIRRIEDKLGIHGSPTCELQFDMAKTELVGRRRFGLIKYVMDLMNGARLAVSAQAQGIAQAAFNEAVDYANEREQFGKKIVEFPAVYQMLKKMEAEVETSRLLLYQTCYYVDKKEMYEEKKADGEKVRDELKEYKAKADLLTPLTKFVTTEMANQVAYDALQIHGGCGFMKDFPVERLYRDARITNIYEGTTQLQVVAALGGIKSGVLDGEFEEFKNMDVKNPDFTTDHVFICNYIDEYQKLVTAIKELESKEFFDYVGNYVVELLSIVDRLVLLFPIVLEHNEKAELFRFYLNESDTRINYLINKVNKLMNTYGKDIGNLKNNFVE
ncbi:MAG: acyl-CoA dehydrogenase family protein [Candidatus Marinimicrobia bacterium]|nr:acyl-CoA dehydrogenase family protein [Candidatus Neomarinimicrobiota bacterium]